MISYFFFKSFHINDIFYQIDLNQLKFCQNIQMQENRTLEEDNTYKFDADTFSLEVSMTNEKLTIRLKDFVDWVIYQKQYSDDDIGKGQIHKKADIFDLYNIITQKRVINDEKNMEEQAQKQQEIKEYKFGEIIKNNSVQCFKIQKHGKIIVFLRLSAANLKNQINCDSHLLLNKVKDMNEIQIFKENFRIEKNTKMKICMKEIQKLKQENKQMKDQLKEVQEKQKIINEENKSMKQLLDQMRLQISLINQKLKVATKQKGSMHQQINKQLKNVKQKVEKNERMLVITKQEFQIEKKKLNSLKKLLAFNQAYLPKFKVTNNNTVEYVGQDSTWTNYIINEQILYNEVYSFKIRILKTKLRQIMIGVVDYTKEKQKRSSYNSNNAVTYYGDGRKWPGSQPAQGAGFKQGEIIEVSVDLSNKIIKWSSNGLRASYTHQILGDKSRIFMPYVELYRTNDSVQILK